MNCLERQAIQLARAVARSPVPASQETLRELCLVAEALRRTLAGTGAEQAASGLYDQAFALYGWALDGTWQRADALVWLMQAALLDLCAGRLEALLERLGAR